MNSDNNDMLHSLLDTADVKELEEGDASALNTVIDDKVLVPSMLTETRTRALLFQLQRMLQGDHPPSAVTRCLVLLASMSKHGFLKCGAPGLVRDLTVLLDGEQRKGAIDCLLPLSMAIIPETWNDADTKVLLSKLLDLCINEELGLHCAFIACALIEKLPNVAAIGDIKHLMFGSVLKDCSTTAATWCFGTLVEHPVVTRDKFTHTESEKLVSMLHAAFQVPMDLKMKLTATAFLDELVSKGFLIRGDPRVHSFFMFITSMLNDDSMVVRKNTRRCVMQFIQYGLVCPGVLVTADIQRLVDALCCGFVSTNEDLDGVVKKFTVVCLLGVIMMCGVERGMLEDNSIQRILGGLNSCDVYCGYIDIVDRLLVVLALKGILPSIPSSGQ